MPWTKCENCKKEVFIKSKADICPDCNNLAILPTKNVELESQPKVGLVSQAINQASILDKFGKVMQTIGYVLIGINSLGSIFALFTSQWILLGICLVSIPLTFAYFNVFGSAFRAIGLYVQIKVK